MFGDIRSLIHGALEDPRPLFKLLSQIKTEQPEVYKEQILPYVRSFDRPLTYGEDEVREYGEVPIDVGTSYTTKWLPQWAPISARHFTSLLGHSTKLYSFNSPCGLDGVEADPVWDYMKNNYGLRKSSNFHSDVLGLDSIPPLIEYLRLDGVHLELFGHNADFLDELRRQIDQEYDRADLVANLMTESYLPSEKVDLGEWEDKIYYVAMQIQRFLQSHNVPSSVSFLNSQCEIINPKGEVLLQFIPVEGIETKMIAYFNGEAHEMSRAWPEYYITPYNKYGAIMHQLVFDYKTLFFTHT